MGYVKPKESNFLNNYLFKLEAFEKFTKSLSKRHHAEGNTYLNVR